ncbi:MAG TPA: isopentenyl phosphate kinase family protein [Chloroflexi bacterium]|nr:isopentenyl phosphate kinase family protein [Chloroflexota bacterium]
MLIFLKLGGSLITDKSRPETARPEAIARLAGEIAEALQAHPDLALLIGHGSGSFGHMAAARYGTHEGVEGPEAWRGFAKVALSAARLNHIMLEALDRAGVPVFRVQPSASAVCRGGQLIEMALRPLQKALEEGLVPLVYGDVAIDEVQGGAIISTETIFGYLAHHLTPVRILLAGGFKGVQDREGEVIARITPDSLGELQTALGGSGQTDVTGGMASKVASMLALCEAIPGLRVHIFSGEQPGNVYTALTGDDLPFGTQLSA